MDGYVSVSHIDSVIHFYNSHFNEFIKKNSWILQNKAKGRIKSTKIEEACNALYSLYFKSSCLNPRLLAILCSYEIYKQFLSVGPGNPDLCPPGNSNFNITVHVT